MPAKPAVLANAIGFRLTVAEHVEIAEFVARAGVRKSDFLRNTILARVREADMFAMSVPESIDRIDAGIAKLHELVSQQSAIIRTLVGASIAHVAGTVDYGATPKAEVDRRIDEAIMHALKVGPVVVNACIQQHPHLQVEQRI